VRVLLLSSLACNALAVEKAVHTFLHPDVVGHRGNVQRGGGTTPQSFAADRLSGVAVLHVPAGVGIDAAPEGGLQLRAHWHFRGPFVAETATSGGGRVGHAATALREEFGGAQPDTATALPRHAGLAVADGVLAGALVIAVPKVYVARRMITAEVAETMAVKLPTQPASTAQARTRVASAACVTSEREYHTDRALCSRVRDDWPCNRPSRDLGWTPSSRRIPSFSQVVTRRTQTSRSSVSGVSCARRMCRGSRSSLSSTRTIRSVTAAGARNGREQ
jgi:hypothetical protein